MKSALTATRNLFEKHPLLFSLLLITAILLIFYSNSFTADWHYDDFHHIKENINIRKFSNIPNLFKDPTTFSRNPNTRTMRPLLMATHALNYQAALLTSRDGYDIRGYHIVNFLFHLLSSFAVFLVTLFIFRNRVSIQDVHPAIPAMFAGLLFGLHTINTETVVYISSRSAGMASMFLFFAFYGYMKATDSDRLRLAALTLSTLSYACGLMTKEIAITLPAMLFFYEFTLNREWMSGLRTGKVISRLAVRWAPYAAVSLAYLWYRHIVLGENLVKQVVTKGGTPAAPDLTAQLATQSRVWIYYLREMLWPTGLSIDKPFTVSRAFSEPKVLVSVLIISGLIAFALLVRKRHPLITFGTLWYFTALLPESVIRLNVVLNDHRLYYSALGGILVFTYIAVRLYARFLADGGWYFRVFVAVCAATLILMGLGTYKRNMAFATEETMWRDVILKDKKSVRGYNNLGIYYEQNKELDKALKFYNKTIQLAPMFPNPYINIGNVYHKKKEYPKAEQYMKRALRLDPRSALANYNLGNILREAGKSDEAVAAYKKALELNPRYIEAANNLANIYFKERKFQEAIRYYRIALTIDPTFAMSYYNIGLSYERLGMRQEAIEAYEQFIRFWIGDPKFRNIAQRKLDSLRRASGQ